MLCVDCTKAEWAGIVGEVSVIYKGDSLCKLHFRERVGLEFNPPMERPMERIPVDKVH